MSILEGVRDPRHLIVRDWKMEPDLELWIDGDGDVASVTARGALDDRTGPSLLEAIERLVREGHREIVVDARGLQITGDTDALSDNLRRSLEALRVKVEWSPEHGLVVPSPRSG